MTSKIHMYCVNNHKVLCNCAALRVVQTGRTESTLPLAGDFTGLVPHRCCGQGPATEHMPCAV